MAGLEDLGDAGYLASIGRRNSDMKHINGKNIKDGLIYLVYIIVLAGTVVTLATAAEAVLG